MSDFLKLILPSAVPTVLAAGLAYYFGRRKAFDDLKIKRGMELAEEIAELYEYFYLFYKENYGHMNDIRDAVDNFCRMTSLFGEEYERIESLNEKETKLRELIRKSRPYLNSNVLDNILLYVSYGSFHYQHDSAAL